MKAWSLKLCEEATLDSPLLVNESLENIVDVLNIASNLQKVGVECSEKVWPRWSLNNHLSVIINNETKTAYEITNSENDLTIEVVEYSKYDTREFKQHFNFFKEYALAATSISINNVRSAQKNPTQLLIHESFHRYFQTNGTWNLPRAESSRATTLPIDFTPLYLRNLMVKKLKESLQQPETSQELLCQVKAIDLELKRSFPKTSDRIRYTDIVEGSAQFVEEYANLISIHPKSCQASHQELLSLFNINKMDSVDKISNQSYQLGALAGLNALMQNIDFQKSVQNGKTPIEALTSSVEVCEIQHDPQSSELYAELARTKAISVKGPFAALMKQFNSPKYIKIMIPGKSMLGNFYVDELIVNTLEPRDLTMLKNFQANFATQNFSAQLSNVDLLMTRDSNLHPCLSGGYILTLRPDEINSEIITDNFEIEAKNLEINDGWICL